jgi:hypothetical protein
LAPSLLVFVQVDPQRFGVVPAHAQVPPEHAWPPVQGVVEAAYRQP